MVSITLSVPEETRKLMKQFPEMNWSGFVRQAIEEKTKKLSERDKWLQFWRDEDKKTAEWSVNLVRAGRQGKIEEFKKKGLI